MGVNWDTILSDTVQDIWGAAMEAQHAHPERRLDAIQST